MNYPQIKPTLNLDFSNTKTLDPRINFRRGTPGAYYDGKTYAKAEENLLSYSENFNDTENYWAEVRASLTGSEESPIDSTSGYKLSQTLTGVAGVLLVTTGKIKLQIGKQYVSSVYVKADNSNYFAIAEEVSRNNPTGNGAFTYFNLSNSGEVMLSHENHIASIQNVGNQWYRCSVMFTAEIEEDYTVMFYLDSGSNQSIISEPQNVASGSSVYLWGAQLEQRDSLTAYTPTNGNPITKYQPQLMFASPDQPRFDHDPITGESKGLLIEEERTNLIEYSEDFSNWSMYNGPLEVTHNTVIAPDGTLTATIIKDISTGSYSGIYESLDINSGDYTSSVFIKQGSSVTSSIWIALTVDGMVKQETITWTAGVPTASSIQFIDMGNGWYRAYVTVTSTTSQSMIMYLLPCGFNATYTGTTVFWGAQLEEGSFPTSYIKTSGAPSGTERSADNASITGENFSSWYRQDEGSLYIDSDKGNLGTSFAGYVSFHTEDFSNSEYYWLLHNSSNQFQFLVAPGVASLVDGIDTSLGSQKACVSWADDDFSMSVNGNTIQSDTDGPGKKNLAGLRIGFSPYSDSHYLNSHIKKISYYPQRLTNEQLQQLTK